MIHGHFQSTGAYDAAQDLSDLFNIRLHNDDVQDFAAKWDQALWCTSEIPTEMVLEGLYKSRAQDTVQLHTVLALYETGEYSKQWTTELFQTDDSGKATYWLSD